MKDTFSLIFKILIVIMCGIGLYLNFNLFSFFGGIAFFTIQSNILVFIIYLIIVILILTKKLKKNNTYYALKGMATMAIGITMLVYQLLISTNGSMGNYENNMLACHMVHLVVPIMVIFDYFVFAEKGNLKKEYPLWWSFILIFYIIFAIFYSLMGGTFAGEKYPYFFLNVEELGFFKVMIYCICIYMFYLGFGYFIQVIDNKLGKKKRLNK